jgi:hypothetical protein
VYKVFEAFQSLEDQVFRLDAGGSAAAYKHSTAHVLHQLGLIGSAEAHPDCRDLRGADEAVRMAEALLARELTPQQKAAIQPDMDALARTRLRMLELRGRRHALNIALMDVGVSVAQTLTPEQWAQIHMQRDGLRAKAEAETFGRVLERLQSP